MTDYPMPLPSVENGGMLASALWYASMGFRVHPLQVGGKFPNRQLLGKGWHVETVGSSDRDVIMRWWTQVPMANIGISQGVKTGTLVIDMDTKRGMDPKMELESWCKVHGVEFTFGPRCITPSGGWHYWMLLPKEIEVIRRVHGWRPGIDVQADGSYVVAPPSVIKERVRARRSLSDPRPRRGENSGNELYLPYRWVDQAGADRNPTQTEFFAALGRSVLPMEFVLDALNTATSRIEAGTDATFADFRDGKHPIPIRKWREDGVPVGEQNNSFFLAACSMAGKGIDRHEALEILREIVAASPLGDADDPWDDELVVDFVNRAYDGKPALDARETQTIDKQIDAIAGDFLRGLGK
jgi:hypothetical protein